jgi:hypothetical protein
MEGTDEEDEHDEGASDSHDSQLGTSLNLKMGKKGKVVYTDSGRKRRWRADPENKSKSSTHRTQYISDNQRPRRSVVMLNAELNALKPSRQDLLL